MKTSSLSGDDIGYFGIFAKDGVNLVSRTLTFESVRPLVKYCGVGPSSSGYGELHDIGDVFGIKSSFELLLSFFTFSFCSS